MCVRLPFVWFLAHLPDSLRDYEHVYWILISAWMCVLFPCSYKWSEQGQKYESKLLLFFPMLLVQDYALD